jgi:cytochrome c nitrite reductase small subunit
MTAPVPDAATQQNPQPAAPAPSAPLPLRWVVFSAVLVGVFAGLAGFTFNYAAGLSYLSDNPATCANCHIMNDQLDSWRKGPHHAVATCNDCHVPPQFPAKYLAKARNGYHHSVGFTFQSPTPDEPGAQRVFDEPIRIKAANSQLLQDNCLRCHGALVHEVVRGSTWADDAIRCVHCHRAVGHGARR